MGPYVPTQQRAFAPLNYFPKMLWISGQGILYRWNSSTLCWACTPGPLQWTIPGRKGGRRQTVYAPSLPVQQEKGQWATEVTRHHEKLGMRARCRQASVPW